MRIWIEESIMLIHSSPKGGAGAHQTLIANSRKKKIKAAGEGEVLVERAVPLGTRSSARTPPSHATDADWHRDMRVCRWFTPESRLLPRGRCFVFELKRCRWVCPQKFLPAPAEQYCVRAKTVKAVKVQLFQHPWWWRNEYWFYFLVLFSPSKLIFVWFLNPFLSLKTEPRSWLGEAFTHLRISWVWAP